MDSQTSHDRDQFSEGFNQLLSKLDDRGQLDLLFRSFGKLKSDSSRISFVREVNGIDKLLEIANIPRLRKSSKTSERKRDEGNKFFQKGQYERALSEYNDSVAYACPHCEDEDGKSNIALAFGNRSAALFHLKKYEDCLRDIEGALKAGYPGDLQYKLYGRRGQCYQAMKRNSEAKDAFEVAKGLLDKAKLDSDKKYNLFRDYQKNIDACNKSLSSKPSQSTDKQNKLPKVADGPNRIHTSLTSACKVAFSEEKGRHVVADRDLRPGEVILVEKPYTAVPRAEEKDHTCQHCLKHCPAPLPCLHCPIARYCSATCRDASWQEYHKYECDFLNVVYQTGMGAKYHLVLRLILVTGLDFLLKRRDEAPPQEAKCGELRGCNGKGRYVAGEYNTIEQLLDHDQHHSTDELACMSARAVFLTRILEKSEFYTQVSDEKREDVSTYLSVLILGHLKRLECSMLDMYQVETFQVLTCQIQYTMFGCGIHSTYNLFNHSCAPTAVDNFVGDLCVVHTLETIRKGQEVSITYGWTHNSHDKFERHLVLQHKFHFVCSCEACINSWQKDYSDHLDSPTFKCGKCRRALPKTPMDSKRCPGCSTLTQIGAKKKIIETSSKDFGGTMVKLQQGLWDEALPEILKYMELLETLVVSPNCQHIICKHMMTMCYGSLCKAMSGK